MLSLNTSISGLQSAQRVQEITAHNVANMQTPGFRALRADIVENANGGSRVASVRPTTTPGSPLLDPIPGSPTVGSNVDLTSELTQQLLSLRAFQANAALVRSQDELLLELLDIRG